MTTEYKNERVSSRARDGGIIGSDYTAWSLSKERLKPVKLADHGFALAGDGDEIHGFLDTINPAPAIGTNKAYITVIPEGRIVAKVVAAGTTVVIGDPIVAAANAALGTAQDFPVVKKFALADNTLANIQATIGRKYWRVVDLRGGGGVAGSEITIQFGNP